LAGISDFFGPAWQTLHQLDFYYCLPKSTNTKNKYKTNTERENITEIN